jgi:hypothetical protein
VLTAGFYPDSVGQPGASPGGDRVDVFEVATTAGPARLRLSGPPAPSGLAALGHGAGGGVDSADLLAFTAELIALGFLVARVEQPYRVAGRRAPAPAAALDAAFWPSSPGRLHR